MRIRSLLLLSAVAACGGPPPPPAVAAVPSILAISADDLRRDVAAFSADSMRGRETGTPAATQAARFIAQRLLALGVEPAGDSMYFQRVPMVRQVHGPGTRFTVNTGTSTFTIPFGVEVGPLLNLGEGVPRPRRIADGELHFAGYGMSTMGRRDFDGIQPGKVIVMLHGAPASVTDTAVRRQLESQETLALRLQGAAQLRPAAIVILMTPGTSELYTQFLPDMLRGVSAPPGDQTTTDAQRPLPMIVLGVARAGSKLLPDGWPADENPQALTGRRFSGRVDVRNETFTGHNVVGIVRGTDARMNKTYVAYGAHYDHIGVQAFVTGDSIANGADDDASGSMTLLALAKSLSAARPRRSSLFVWHVGEEKGLLGSAWYVDHATVPADSIIAQINLDMIGRRGGATAQWNSAAQGASAADRVYVVGPRAAPNSQSRTLGAVLDTVNARQLRPLVMDHEWDSQTHPERIYERSDHYSYAKKGIPVVFLTTGLHEDYHKVSDEASKLDYEKMARIGSLLLELGTTLANREARPR